jgi:hypothetical protein
MESGIHPARSEQPPLARVRLPTLEAQALLHAIENKDYLPDQLTIEDLIGNMQQNDFKEVNILVVRLLLCLHLKKFKKLANILDEMRFRENLSHWERSLFLYCELKLIKQNTIDKKRATAFYQHAILPFHLQYCERPARFFLDLARIYSNGNSALLKLLKKRNAPNVPRFQ